MITFLKNMHSTRTIQGLFLGLLFIGTVSFGQFIAPTGNPTSSGTNSVASLTSSTTPQIKDGDLGVSIITATKELCLGANCITSFWPTTIATTCKLEAKQIQNSTSNLNVYNTSCDMKLTPEARNQGWVSTGFDFCTSLSGGNCNSQAQCSYMRLVCTGVATTTAPVSVMHTTYPVTGAMVGETYPFFLKNPQCNDGLNNDGLVGIDYPADPQCANYADDDEAT